MQYIDPDTLRSLQKDYEDRVAIPKGYSINKSVGVGYSSEETAKGFLVWIEAFRYYVGAL